MKKKAQLQIMENAFILIIIFIILIIAFIFVMSIQASEQRKKQDEIHTLELIKRSQVMNFLPEMQCSDYNNLNPSCYDLLRIFSFQKSLEDDRDYYNYYKTILGNVYISVMRFDPSPPVNKVIFETVIFDNPKPDDKGYQEVRFPVLLRNVTQDSDYFGVIFLRVYE